MKSSQSVQDGFTGASKKGYAIQPALWPEIGISTEESAYLRLAGPVGLSLSQNNVTFQTGGQITSDTYANLFNVGKWRDLCGEIPFALRLEGKGRVQLKIIAAPQDQSWEQIYGEVVNLADGQIIPLDLAHLAHPRAVLFFELTALSEGVLDDFAWVSTQEPRQLPDLMLSVTTFKRETAVLATISRFQTFIADSDLKPYVHLTVVDNGRSVTLNDPGSVHLIPNENLGGAGGFSRGLLAARAMGASHCLFMDDDAAIHMGAITRTWWLLAYALDPRTAVAGAMLNEKHCWQMWENGAVFDRGCKPQYFRTDTRDRESIFHMEHETTYPSPPGFYAGWWFFAFPVAQAKHMPFPFFVRGDDVSFSLANDFRIVTLPGVASVQESFSDKSSPLTWYLDMRSHLVHHLSIPSKDVSWRALQKMFLSFYLRTVLRFHYDSLSAVNLAIEDVMQGPAFFAENADMAQRRADLKALNTTEVWTPVETAVTLRRGGCSRPLRALLLLTLNGHLLPFSNWFGTHLVIEATHRENFQEVYGAKDITYLNADRTSAYAVHRNHRRFWQETTRLIKNSLALRKTYREMKKTFRGQYNPMTSEAFWRDKLGL